MPMTYTKEYLASLLRIWRIKNPDKVAAQNKRSLERKNRWMYEKIKNDPEYRAKKYARNLVQSKIRHGTLVRSSRCEKCGKKTKTEAHHFKGYAKKHRLDVLWLCHECHVHIHK